MLPRSLSFAGGGGAARRVPPRGGLLVCIDSGRERSSPVGKPKSFIDRRGGSISTGLPALRLQGLRVSLTLWFVAQLLLVTPRLESPTEAGHVEISVRPATRRWAGELIRQLWCPAYASDFLSDSCPKTAIPYILYRISRYQINTPLRPRPAYHMGERWTVRAADGCMRPFH